MTAPLKRRGAAFFMLFGMEPFFSRGSGEMKRGKSAITFPGIPPFFGGCLFCYFKGDNAFLASLATPGGAGGTMDAGQG